MKSFKRSFTTMVANLTERNRSMLESKARQANWLAHKTTGKTQRQLFAVKHRAVSQLFAHRGFEPAIESVEINDRGLMLSIRLIGWGRLHVPVEHLSEDALKYVTRVRVQKVYRNGLPFGVGGRAPESRRSLALRAS